MAKKKLDFTVDANGCFICTSHKAKTKASGNYNATRVFRNGKYTTMPRWIFGQCFGELPKGLVVRHTCHNGLCINPEHMTSGTPKQNSADMVAAGRNTNGPRILDEEKAKRIKKQLADGIKVKDIASVYGVAPATIRDIQKGRRWTDENIRRREKAKGEA